jgi:hypothetical protein
MGLSIQFCSYTSFIFWSYSLVPKHLALLCILDELSSLLWHHHLYPDNLHSKIFFLWHE